LTAEKLDAEPNSTVMVVVPLADPKAAMSAPLLFQVVRLLMLLVEELGGATDVKLFPVRVHGFVAVKLVVVFVVPLAEIRICVGLMISVIVDPEGMPLPLIVWPTLSPVLLATVITLLPSCT
jgi:hypothetical protein